MKVPGGLNGRQATTETRLPRGSFGREPDPLLQPWLPYPLTSHFIMKNAIEKEILRECKKHIMRHNSHCRGVRDLQRRFQRRTGEGTQRAKITPPPHWSLSSHFNPFSVKKKASRLASAISAALSEGRYKPKPCFLRGIKKDDESLRHVSIFGIADSAVAQLFYRAILTRNQSRFSRYAFAYRSDVGVHDAIEYLYSYFREMSRVVLVEFDFSKFFDCVSHDYLRKVLMENFQITNREMAVIDKFLQHEKAYDDKSYRAGKYIKNEVGIPQGNSLSLFLANALCVELDRSLERIGVVFARFADDTVILSDSIEKASGAAAALLDFSVRAGAPINFRKSAGISTLTPEALGPRGQKDVNLREGFDFLGHRFAFQLCNVPGKPAQEVRHVLSIRSSSESKIRDRVQTITYNHLLLYPMRGKIGSRRISSGVDWDLVRCINDLRDLVYGGAEEQHIQAALEAPDVRLTRLRSVMSFFPLIDDVNQLRELDGWLTHILFSAIKKRRGLLKDLLPDLNYPMISKEELLSGSWYPKDLLVEVPNETQMPSFVRAWMYSRKGLKIFDLKDFRQSGGLLDVYVW